MKEERRKDIESIRIDSGKRTYFITAVETIDGSKYMKITQRTSKENGDIEYVKIFIYKDTLDEICSALGKILKHFDIKKELLTHETNQPPIASAGQKNYKPWNAKDDLKLEKLYCKQKTIDELIVILERSNSDIEARIQKLGLEDKYDFNDLD